MPPSIESPHSSLQGSFGGTPDTRITTFSPEDARIKSAAGSVIATPQRSLVSNDPFMSENKGKPEQKLSATASAFQPFGLRPVIEYALPPRQDPIPGSVDYLVKVIKEAKAPEQIEQEEVASFGTFTTSTIRTRNLRVSSLFNRDIVDIVEATMRNIEQSGSKFKGARRYASVGPSLMLKFDHIDDVGAVYAALRALGDLSVEFITAAEFAQVVSPGRNFAISIHEGEITVRISYAARPVGISKKAFGEYVIDSLKLEGELCALRRVVDPGSLHIVAEFADATMAVRAISRLNGQTMGAGAHAMTVTRNEPDLIGTQAVARYLTPAQTPTRGGGILDLSSALSNLSVGTGRLSEDYTSPQSGAIYTQGNPFMMQMGTPFGPGPAYLHGTQVQLGAFGALSGYAYPQLIMPTIPCAIQQEPRNYSQPFSPVSSRDGYSRRQQNRPFTPGRYRGNSSANHNSHHNQVEIARIKGGTDVRTTVMLRNIPNKVDQAMLKAIIDESSFGRYDFMYLRIDFSNNCNVGYAFINFIDPLDIIDFVEQRANKPWESFKSDKIAEVSYATIQGRDCLIQKFRNSSVMLEPAHYRPKLFFTFNDTYGRVGEEDEFPASDNASKLKRSCENAEHVGLFAPSAGAHMRDEQRRRRSQYDRGTSLAAREEFEYDPAFGYQY